MYLRVHFSTSHLLYSCNIIVGIPKELDVSKSGGPSFITNQPAVFKLPDLGSLPHSLALGTVGMPGYLSFIRCNILDLHFEGFVLSYKMECIIHFLHDLQRLLNSTPIFTTLQKNTVCFTFTSRMAA